MYDVGANAGFFTLIALDLGAIVHAFEPNPRLRALTARSLAMRVSPRAYISPLACSDAEGQATLYLSDGQNTGMTSLVRPTPHQIEVHATTLTAHWLATGATPDLIKIDVESHELAVIRGARELLHAEHPDLIVEVTARAVITTLEELGYHAHRITSDGRPVAFDPSSLSFAAGYTNLFFSTTLS